MKRWSMMLALAICISPAWAKNPEVGKPAPAFSLTAIDGKSHNLSDFKGKYVVLEWTNYDCPFVRKHYGAGNMQALQKKWTEKGVIWLSVGSSAPGKQGHFEPDQWKARAAQSKATPTAILLDPTGQIGRRYVAQTTPHMFIINPAGYLIYQGAIDSKPSTESGDIPESINYVDQALTESLAGKAVSVPQTKPYGCSVKYK